MDELGGRLEHGAAPGGGLRLSARVPLRSPIGETGARTRVEAARVAAEKGWLWLGPTGRAPAAGPGSPPSSGRSAPAA